MITRVYTFDNITVRDNTKIDDELDNIISFLDGSALDEVILVVDDDIEPPLTNVAISRNPSFDIRKNNSTSVYLCNKNGSIESLIATGVAPFDITSTTLCTNLNAHYLDDIDGEKFNSQDLPDQFFLGNLIIEKLTTGSNNLSVLQDGDILKLRRSSDNASILEIQDLNESTRKINLGSVFNLKATYNPIDEESATNNTDFDILRYQDILDTSEILFFANTSNTLTGAQTDKVIASWICGIPISGLATFRRLYCYKGTSTGTVTITLYKNGSSAGVLSIPSGSDINAPHSVDINVDAEYGDVFVIKATTSGSQNYLCCGCIGDV